MTNLKMTTLHKALEQAPSPEVLQALTDPENQPNQFGVAFGMHGPRMFFSIGNQSFDLAYEPDEAEEFEFMKRMLCNAFSTFTPDVKSKPAPSTAGELTTGIPHSLAGFRCAFESEHGRKPTEQEIWNAAIRSWRDLQPSPALMYSLDADPQGIRARVVQAVLGALAFGTRNENKPPEGHWLNEIWESARAERELAAARSQPVREPLTDDSDTATIAGLESSVGHLSVMVDELRLMLGDAMNAMTELHSKVTPDEDTPNIDGIVPAAAYAKFVDAHADLLYRIHHSPHEGQLSRLPAAHGITKKGEA